MKHILVNDPSNCPYRGKYSHCNYPVQAYAIYADGSYDNLHYHPEYCEHDFKGCPLSDIE